MGCGARDQRGERWLATSNGANGNVGDEHVARRVADRERRLDRHDQRLRRHSASPEDGYLVLAWQDGVAPMRSAEVSDADPLGVADVERAPMGHR